MQDPLAFQNIEKECSPEANITTIYYMFLIDR